MNSFINNTTQIVLYILSKIKNSYNFEVFLIIVCAYSYVCQSNIFFSRHARCNVYTKYSTQITKNQEHSSSDQKAHLHVTSSTPNMLTIEFVPVQDHFKSFLIIFAFTMPHFVEAIGWRPLGMTMIWAFCAVCKRKFHKQFTQDCKPAQREFPCIARSDWVDKFILSPKRFVGVFIQD